MQLCIKIVLIVFFCCWQSIGLIAGNTGGPDDPTFPDSLSQPRGHCKAQVRLDTNCATQEITISAYVYWTWTTVLQPVVATWSTGQTAHKITVIPPGTWSWDPSGTTCEEYHWETETTLNLPFFEGPVELTAPPAICPDQGFVEIEANLNNYSHFETLTWSPPNPNGDFEPYPVSQAGTYSITVEDPYGCVSSDQVTIADPVIFNPGIAGPVRMCPEGDTSELSIINPSLYTAFQWENGETTSPITIFDPGTYQITATDVYGCTGTNAFSVQSGGVDPFGIALSSPSLCPGQTDTLRVLGGFSQYLWSNNVSGISNIIQQTGTYTVTVTNSYGCTGTSSITIMPQLPPVIQVVSTPLCPGDTAVISVSGGSFPHYIWSSGQTTQSIQVVQPGTYTVTVSGQGVCSTSSADSLVIAEMPVASIDPPGLLNCLVNQINLMADSSSSGPGFSFQWSTPNGHFASGDSTLHPVADAPGSYLLSIRNDSTGCTARDTVQVDQNISPPPADAGLPNALTCNLPQINIGPLPTPTDPDLLPAWATTDGNILSGQNSWLPEINQPGTYILTVTQAINGCTNTSSVTIGEDILAPDAQIETPPIITCVMGIVPLDGSASSSGPNIQYQWTTNDGLFNGQTNAPGSNAASVGTYQLQVTNTSNGCTGTAEVTVSADVNIPVTTAIPPDTLTCTTHSVVIDASQSSSGPGYQYQWSTLNGNILSGQNGLTLLVDAPGAYLLTLVNSLNNCTATLAVNVAENTIHPISDAGDTQTLNCTQLTSTLDGSGSSTGLAFTYQWSSTDGNIVFGAQTLNPEVNQSGTYQLMVTDQTNGCTSVSSVNILQDSNAPSAVIAQPGVLSCLLVQTILDASASTNTGNLVYQWTGNIASGQGTLQAAVDQPGIYQLTVTNLDNGCMDQETITVTQDIQAPVADIQSGGILTCSVTSLGLEANILSASSSNLNFQWSTSTGQIVSGQNSPTPLIIAPGDYNLTVTDAVNGCTGSDQVSVLQDITPPIVLLEMPGLLTCAQTTLVIDAAGCSIGSQFQYQWSSSPGGHFASMQNMNSPVVDAPGDYTLTITNLTNGCSQSATVPVNQDIQLPTAEAGASLVLDCDTPAGQLNGTGSSVGTEFQYQWTTLDGQIQTGTGTLNPSIAASGTYTLTVENTLNGCTQTDEVLVTEDMQAPHVLITSPATLNCIQTSIQLFASGSQMGTAPIFNWSASGGGNIVSGGNTLNPIIDAPGVYQLQAVNTLNGCMAMQNVTVNEDIQIPTVQIQPPLILTCSLDQFSLQATTAAQALLSWSTDQGHFVSGVNGLNPVIDLPGIYVLTVTNPGNGCSNSTQVMVAQEQNIPVGLLYQLDPPLCNGTAGALVVEQVDGGIGPYTYSIDGGQTYQSSEALQGLQPGAYQLAIQDANGCEIMETIQVPEPPVPAVNIPPAFGITLGEHQVLSAIIPPTFPVSLIDTVIWTPSEGLAFEGNSISDLLNPVSVPYRSTYYTVTIFTKEGCQASARTLIQVDRQVDIYAPNIIWPEDPDGNNALFTLFARDESVAMIRTLQIFDRWGSMIFSNQDFRPNDPQAGWDGKDRGEPVNPAVFVWWAKVELIDGREVLIKGDVTVLR